ncbi:hypothetical protein JCM6882_003912 [Rhodosporidiobolus microsporus]
MTRARSVSCSTPPTSPHLAVEFKDLDTPPLSPSPSSESSDSQKEEHRRRRRSTSLPGEPPVLNSLGLGIQVAEEDSTVTNDQRVQPQPEVTLTPYSPEPEYTFSMKGFQSSISPIVNFYPPHYAPQYPQASAHGAPIAPAMPPYMVNPPSPPPPAGPFFGHPSQFRSFPPSPPVTPSSMHFGYPLENGLIGPHHPCVSFFPSFRPRPRLISFPSSSYPAPPSSLYHPQAGYPYPPPMYPSYPTPAASGASTPTPYWSMPFMAPPAPSTYNSYAAPYMAPVADIPRPMSIAERLLDGETIVSRGIVKFFMIQKGYGFIRDQHADDLGTDVFVHYTAIHLKDGFRCLAEGEEVEYTLVKAIEKHTAVVTGGPKPRFQALGVTGPGGSNVIGANDPKNAEILRQMAKEAEDRKKNFEDDMDSDSSTGGKRTKATLMRNGKPRKPPVVPKVVEVPTSVARKMVVLPHQQSPPLPPMPYRRPHYIPHHMRRQMFA